MELTTAPAAPGLSELLVVDLDRFQGPLDLLLHLIRQQDIDIFDIPIAAITRQFLATIQQVDATQLENAGEFLEMAATLVRIKAQMLLPRHGEDEDEDPRAELVRRLLEYEQVLEISRRLLVAEADRGRLRGKGYIAVRPPRRVMETKLRTTWADVHKAALRVTLPEPLPRDHRVTLRPIAIEEKVDLIMDALRTQARVRFSGLVGPWRERMHGVMTILAGLELSKRRLVALRQLRPFTELWIFRQSDEDPIPRDVALDEDKTEAA